MGEFSKGIFLSPERSEKDFPEVIFKLRSEEVGFDQADRIMPKGPDVGMRFVCPKEKIYTLVTLFGVW